MKIGQQITTCAYDSTVTQAVVNDNQETTGYLAVSLVGDNAQTSPVPLVKLSDAAAGQVYGALATINIRTQRCGVITSGIVPFKKSAVTAAGDIAKGIVPITTTTNRGEVSVAATDGNGRGTVVNRGGDTSVVLWVDLDVDTNAVPDPA